MAAVMKVLDIFLCSAPMFCFQISPGGKWPLSILMRSSPNFSLICDHRKLNFQKLTESCLNLNVTCMSSYL